MRGPAHTIPCHVMPCARHAMPCPCRCPHHTPPPTLARLERLGRLLARLQPALAHVHQACGAGWEGRRERGGSSHAAPDWLCSKSILHGGHGGMAMPSHAQPYHATPKPMLCHAMPRPCSTPCHAMPLPSMPCHAMPLPPMPCHAMPALTRHAAKELDKHAEVSCARHHAMAAPARHRVLQAAGSRQRQGASEARACTCAGAHCADRQDSHFQQPTEAAARLPACT